MKTTRLWWATSRSSHAIDAYATTRLTRVARIVGAQPTDALIAFAWVSPS